VDLMLEETIEKDERQNSLDIQDENVN